MAPKPAIGPEGINAARMAAERVARARQVMTSHNVPALLVTGASNVRYLTGFTWAEFQPRLSYVLFFAEHDPVIFAHAGSYQQMPEIMSFIKHWRIARAWMEGIAGPEATREEAKEWAQEIRDELAERGLADEPLGVIGYDSQVAQEALKETGLHAVDGVPLLLEASKIKTRDEINCLSLAACFGTVGWQKALDVLRPGITLRELALTINHELHTEGAETAFTGPAFGPLAFERNVTPINRRIEHGDVGYLAFCGTSFMGYSACLYRSFVVGRKPTDKEKGWYGELRSRIHAVIDEMKPGGLTSDAAKHFPPASKWGYKHEAEVLTVEWGHGIGLTSMLPASVHYNWPIINRQWSLKHPQVFEPGMVMAVESLEGEHRVGGVRLEHMVLITEDGPQILDHFPADEILAV